MPTIQANGTRFNYEISGREGAPWITFSNSLATNLGMWDAQAALVSGDWRVLRYDQRGHGATEASEPPYGFAQLGADVVALWDALGVETSVFCGLSMGGTTGYGLALDYGERLTAFIACDSRCDSVPAFVSAWDERIAYAREHGMDGMAEPTVNRWFTERFRQRDTATIDRVKQMIRTTSLDGFIGCSNALQNIGFRERLGEIAVPTLFICGAEDTAAGPDYVRPVHEAVAGSGFEMIADAGHIANVENPVQFNAVLGGYLASL